MAEHYRTQGIILRKQDAGEADRVFTVFTKDFGKLKLRAISERKITSKLRGGLEMFCLSELEFIQGKTKKTLTDALLENRYTHIRNDLGRLKIAYRILEALDAIVHGQEPDENIWNLLMKTFTFLNREELDEKTIRFVPHYFLWNLLSHAGYKPQSSDIKREFPRLADLLKIFLQEDIEQGLQKMRFQDIPEDVLRTISHEYLSKFLENC